jgi:hypothetical protein
VRETWTKNQMTSADIARSSWTMNLKKAGGGVIRRPYAAIPSIF